MTFKEWAYECETCGAKPKVFHWDTDPIPSCVCGGTLHPYSVRLDRNRGVIDDQIEGGPRWFETFGHQPVWIETKSDWRKAVDKYQVVNVVKHDSDYYARRRKWHDEERRDTGQNVEC